MKTPQRNQNASKHSREGGFTSILDLDESYLSDRDEKPKRYVWKAEGQEILAKIHRARTAMNQASGYE